MKLPDRITGRILMLLGIATFYGGSRLPPVPGQPVGPDVFPMVIGAGLAVVGLLIALHIGRGFEDAAEAEVERFGGPDREAEEYARRRRWHALLPPALMVFYYFTSERIGFIPVAAIMIGALAYALGANRRLILPVSIVGAIFIQVMFVKLLRVPLPAGLVPMPW